MNHARFGVAEIEGEDEHKGDVWFQIGPCYMDGDGWIVNEEMAVVMLRSADEMEVRFPGIRERKLKAANMIAEALNDYANKHGLAVEDIPV